VEGFGAEFADAAFGVEDARVFGLVPAELARASLRPAEVEMVGFGWGGAALPVGAVVGGAEDGAFGSAGPCDSVAEGVNAAEAGGGVGVLDLELGLCRGGEGEGGS